MFNNKFILIILSIVFIFLFSCKKKNYELLPELDLGNNMNPKSGVEYVKLDSTRIYYAPGKILKSYVSLKSNLISDMGFTCSRINVYKNGQLGAYLIANSTNKYFTDNVVTGQIIKFEFTIIDVNGRESKKSIPYIVTVP